MQNKSQVRRERSAKNLVFSLISQMTIVGSGLLLPRLYLVYFGSEINGLLNSVTQVIAYLSLFEAGIAATALQALYKPVALEDRGQINGILAAVRYNYINFGRGYTAILLMVSITYPLFITRESIGYVTTVLIVLMSGGSFVLLFFVQGKYQVLLRAEGKNYIIVNVQTMTTIAASVAKIICISLELDILVVVFSSFLVSLIEAIIIIAYIHSKYEWIDLTVPMDSVSLREKNYVLLHQIAFIVFQNTDMILLSFFCDLKTVSVYSIYKLVVRHVANLLYVPFNSISFALGQLFHQSKEKYAEAIDTVDILYGALCFAVLSVTLKMYPTFISFYTHGVQDINYSSHILPVLFVGVELLSFFRYPMQNTIQYAGHFRKTLPQTLIETGINIIISVVLVRGIGISGVLIGTIAALIYRGVEMVYYANSKILNRSAAPTFRVYAFHTVLFLITQFVFSVFSMEVSSVLSFFLVGLVYIVISLIIFAGCIYLAYPRIIKSALRIIRD